MDTKSLFCQRLTLCCRHDGIGRHVQATGHIQYGHRPVHELVVSALGDQAILESIRGHSQDQEVLDHRNATVNRRRPGRRGADDPNG